MTLLYCGNSETDTDNVLSFIDQYTTNLDIQSVRVERSLVARVVKGMYCDFPCSDGLENASVFKKAANFAAYFIGERPITDPFPKEIIGDTLFGITNHQNAMLAFAISANSLHKATIVRSDGAPAILHHPISVSQHSYIDIIEAISSISPATHFKLLTVLFEQLAYKANPDAQYSAIDV